MERFSIHSSLFFWSSNLKHNHAHGNPTFKHTKTTVYKVNQSWGPWILTSLLRLISFGCKLWCQCWLGLNLKVQCTVGVARGHHITGGFAEWHEVTWSDMNARGISHQFTNSGCSSALFTDFICFMVYPMVFAFKATSESWRVGLLSEACPVDLKASNEAILLGRVEDLSESSILSYSFYHSLSMLVQSLLCLENVSSDVQIPLQFLFVSAFESRGEPSCETSAS